MPRGEPAHLDLLFAGSIYCDLVFAGVPTREPGAEVYAEAFKLTPGGVANRAVAQRREQHLPDERALAGARHAGDDVEPSHRQPEVHALEGGAGRAIW